MPSDFQDFSRTNLLFYRTIFTFLHPIIFIIGFYIPFFMQYFFQDYFPVFVKFQDISKTGNWKNKFVIFQVLQVFQCVWELLYLICMIHTITNSFPTFLSKFSKNISTVSYIWNISHLLIFYTSIYSETCLQVHLYISQKMSLHMTGCPFIPCSL